MSISSALKTPFTSAASRLMGPPEARSILALNPTIISKSSHVGSCLISPPKNREIFFLNPDTPRHRMSDEDRIIFALNPDTIPPSSLGAPRESIFDEDGWPELRFNQWHPNCVSSGNPCLDFFFQVVPDTRPSTISDLLSSAWAHDPLTALKLVFNLRGHRFGAGKFNNEGFYACALWLHAHHPKTLAANVDSIARFGYMKDLLIILHRLLHGIPHPWKKTKRLTESLHPEEAALFRRKRRAEYAARALHHYSTDPAYQHLHDRVADFFAIKLNSDIESLRSGGTGRRIGLAAKWCPSPYSPFDRHTLICESIARRMFPLDSDPAYEHIPEEHYAYRIRDRLRKEVLVPLREALQLPEVHMSAKNWGQIRYDKVTSVAMRNYIKLFKKHDQERFGEFIEEVRAGKAMNRARALLPHQIASWLRHDRPFDGLNEYYDRAVVPEMAELLWERMVRDLLGAGKLRNCIAVCRASSYMNPTPMFVSMTMGLMLSDLSEEPWKGRTITFNQKPRLYKIKGKSLGHKLGFMQKMHEWGIYTDFQKVFDVILEVAVKRKLEPEKMIKRVFVFCDIEFDKARSPYNYKVRAHQPPEWETDYEAICRKFEAAGYGCCVPTLVFWNLEDMRSVPVMSKLKGLTLVRGFSKKLLKLFLEGNEESFDPKSIVEKAISGREYDKLMVVD